MKQVFVLLIALAGLLVWQSNAFTQGAAEKEQGVKMATSKPDGKALWNHLKDKNYSKNWKMWPGKKAFYKGTEPHGALLTTYVNLPALNDIKAKKGKLSPGSIIVKENYSPDRKLMATTVMYKVENYNQPANDWFWAKYDPKGKVEASGKVEGCISCHGAKKQNDYIMTEQLR